eukprot:jgi/Mesvir1/6912/Mv26572-RA.1
MDGFRRRDTSDVPVRTPEQGGFLYATDAQLSFLQSRFIGSTAFVASVLYQQRGSATFVDCWLQFNQGIRAAGAILSDSPLSMTNTMVDSTMTNYGQDPNQLPSAAIVLTDGTSTFLDCTFSNNRDYLGAPYDVTLEAPAKLTACPSIPSVSGDTQGAVFACPPTELRAFLLVEWLSPSIIGTGEDSPGDTMLKLLGDVVTGLNLAGGSTDAVRRAGVSLVDEPSAGPIGYEVDGSLYLVMAVGVRHPSALVPERALLSGAEFTPQETAEIADKLYAFGSSGVETSDSQGTPMVFRTTLSVVYEEEPLAPVPSITMHVVDRGNNTSRPAHILQVAFDGTCVGPGLGLPSACTSVAGSEPEDAVCAVRMPPRNSTLALGNLRNNYAGTATSRVLSQELLQALESREVPVRGIVSGDDEFGLSLTPDLPKREVGVLRVRVAGGLCSSPLGVQNTPLEATLSLGTLGFQDLALVGISIDFSEASPDHVAAIPWSATDAHPVRTHFLLNLDNAAPMPMLRPVGLATSACDEPLADPAVIPAGTSAEQALRCLLDGRPSLVAVALDFGEDVLGLRPASIQVTGGSVVAVLPAAPPAEVADASAAARSQKSGRGGQAATDAVRSLSRAVVRGQEGTPALPETLPPDRRYFVVVAVDGNNTAALVRVPAGACTDTAYNVNEASENVTVTRRPTEAPDATTAVGHAVSGLTVVSIAGVATGVTVGAVAAGIAPTTAAMSASASFPGVGGLLLGLLSQLQLPSMMADIERGNRDTTRLPSRFVSIVKGFRWTNLRLGRPWSDCETSAELASQGDLFNALPRLSDGDAGTNGGGDEGGADGGEEGPLVNFLLLIKENNGLLASAPAHVTRPQQDSLVTLLLREGDKCRYEMLSEVLLWAAVLLVASMLLHGAACLAWRAKKGPGVLYPNLLQPPRIEIIVVIVSMPALAQASGLVMSEGTVLGLILGSIIMTVYLLIFTMLFTWIWVLRCIVGRALGSNNFRPPRVEFSISAPDEAAMAKWSRWKHAWASITRWVAGRKLEGQWTDVPPTKPLQAKSVNKADPSGLVPVSIDMVNVDVVTDSNASAAGGDTNGLGQLAGGAALAEYPQGGDKPAKRVSFLRSHPLWAPDGYFNQWVAAFGILYEDFKGRRTDGTSEGFVSRLVERMRCGFILFQICKRMFAGYLLGIVSSAESTADTARVQVALVLGVLGVHLVFLVALRPFHNRWYQLAYTIAGVCEVVLFAITLTVVGEEGAHLDDAAGSAMLFFLFTGVLASILLQLYMIASLFHVEFGNLKRARRQAQEARAQANANASTGSAQVLSPRSRIAKLKARMQRWREGVTWATSGEPGRLPQPPGPTADAQAPARAEVEPGKNTGFVNPQHWKP